MEDSRYIRDKEKFLVYAYLALKDHFSSKEDFNDYYNAIKTDEQKNLFLKTASFYLFLVKNGDWYVDIPDSDKVIDYLTNTYKYVSIFSLIESLSEDKFIDFYEFLIRKKSKNAFPISNKDGLEEYYKRYKNEFGSIKRCISFFKALSPHRQKDLISKLKVQETEPTIENLAKYLYELRSNFVHESNLVLHMSAVTSVGRRENKVVICNLSINDVKVFFEEGLLIYFQNKKDSKRN